MREQQGLPPWRVGNYFVSSLLDPSILVLITLLQQVFSIYTGAQACPSARRPSSCNQQESYREAVFSQGDSTRDGEYPRAMLGGGEGRAPFAVEGCDCVPNAFIFLQELEQGAQAGGVEPGGVEEAEAPPEPTPVMEIVPAPAEEEEDQEAPDNPLAVILDAPPEGVPMAPALLHGLARPLPIWSLAPGFWANKPLPPDNPSKVPVPARVPRQSSRVRAQPPPSSLLLPPLQPPLEEGVVCRRWFTLAPTLIGIPPRPSFRSASSC